MYFPKNSSHTDCHISNIYIYLFLRGFRSENGMSSTEMSPTRASLAAESAAEFPIMPTWPGTQIKTTDPSTEPTGSAGLVIERSRV